MIDILERMDEYEKDHCWQYDIRLNNLKGDMEDFYITQDEIDKMRVKDFKYEEVTCPKERKNLTKFIQKHEWLGNLSQFTTHWFGAYYITNDGFGEIRVLAGVILMNMPNAFSKLLGEETPALERLVSRGACISWSPKNLASNFLMWSIKHMVQTTRYRMFSAYSDPTAKELGTIYQACNWIYTGQNAGTTKRYINPYNGRLVSDRVFRARSFYNQCPDFSYAQTRAAATQHALFSKAM